MIYIFEKIVTKNKRRILFLFNLLFIFFLFLNLAFGGEYTIFAGLEECLKFIRDYKFHTTDIDYLRKVLPTYIEEGYFNYLLDLNMNDIKVFAVPEGKYFYLINIHNKILLI